MTAASAVDIQTAHFPWIACTPWCSCVCLRERRFRTTQLLQEWIGSLFVGYSELPVMTEQCDQHACHLQARSTSSIAYFFPTLAYGSCAFSHPSIHPTRWPSCLSKFQRAISGDADIFQFCKARRGGQDKQVFENGLTSPHDVHCESGVKTGNHVFTFVIARSEVDGFFLQIKNQTSTF